jgi:hypothetical protein
VRRLDRCQLLEILRAVDDDLREPASLLLVGGAAVLLLTQTTRVTLDVDLLASEGVERALEVAERRATSVFSLRSDAFEICLPEDWRDRLTWHDLRLTHLTIGTPAPEDLAVMKVFRFLAKDADDIASLFHTPGFGHRAWRRRFIDTLPYVIGEPRWHAQSFVMIWNRLVPEEPLRVEDVVGVVDVR